MSVALYRTLQLLSVGSSMPSEMSSNNAVNFKHVYVSYKDKIYSYVYYRVGNNRDVAEDVVSDVFLKAYKAFDSYDARYAVSTWLYTIARNTLTDYYRTHKDVVDIENIPAADETDPLYMLIHMDISLTELTDAIAALPEKQARYIRKQFLEGYSAKEIAAAEDVSHAAVRKQVSRGLALLREKLLTLVLFVGVLETCI